ncbi:MULTISPECIES: hypothetical protein [unclassified Corynebacterium]|uniref:hypothetical protein n=1 Tax=unclassified Corynebacterium TaxID=2624378 RepID=UPI0008A579AA|nr:MULTISPECIES: hypothetical protein [unclassified Corynebacterium]OFN78962.1 hypothetical protein HMPREF2537_04055 [Corynebacterium sp. HMSC074E01]OHO61051.1 hypothetical protein HMPREF2743_04560 [Corynebacterium sp. HMSC036D02]
MFDPTRIDRTLAALRAAWEGQPDLPLGTLFGMLAAEGYGWGVPDGELTARLESMAAVHPPLVPLDAHLITEGLWLVVTPSHRVTLTPNALSKASAVPVAKALTEPSEPQTSRPGCMAVVRPVSKEGQRGQPVAWQVSALRAVGPGRPLVLADTEGFEHRFGVVESVTRLREDSRSLTGLKRRSVGDRVWFIRTDTETILLDHGLHMVERKNRELIRTDFSWHRIEEGEIGKPLRIHLSRGTMHTLGVIKELILAESEPWSPPSSPPH